MSATTNLCLVCNASCSLVRNSIQIFGDTPSNDINLPVVLENLLDKEITSTSIHSGVLCRKCYKLIDEFDELQSRVSEIKHEIFTNYQNSLKSNETPTDTTKGVGSTAPEKLLIRKGRNELPKKILDIPSSDDEDASQPVDEKSLESLADIEMALVENDKREKDTDTNIKNETHQSHTFSNSVVEELAIQAHSELNNMVIKKESTVLVESNKPNILKRKPQSRIIYSENEIIQETNEIVKKITETLGAPLVTRTEELYTCLLCPDSETVSGEAKAIIHHLKNVHDEKLYICDICGLDFRRRNLLTAHVNEHIASEEGDFQCEVCNRIFNNLRLFRIHRRIHLPMANKAWQCSQCDKRYSSNNLLQEHMNTHLGVRPYVCNTCGKDFANKYSFRAHEKTHSSRPRPFECDKCAKSFLTQQNLAQHEKTHISNKEYACLTCNKRFGSAHNLDMHSIVHTGFKPFVCGLCGKCFARKAEIRDHERTHTGERPFQCEFCGATFSQRSNLQSHKRATHYDDKRYKCDICDKCFKRRRLLDYHMKAAHTGERPYKCETCKATFVYPEHFKKHRRIHTGEKPFVCEICGKAFNSRDNRNAHRFVHSDKKPYECLVCGAGFMRKPHLYTHMQVANHLNDAIVVNQPRLTVDDKVGIDAESHLVTIEELADGSDSKMFIEGLTGDDNEDGIILNSAKLTFGGDSSEDGDEIIDEIEQVISTEDGEYEEILSTEAISAGDTQIIDTPDGPIQLVKVKINKNGEEEEAWIKIVPE